jgi:hypothetical protein
MLGNVERRELHIHFKGLGKDLNPRVNGASLFRSATDYFSMYQVIVSLKTGQIDC